MEDINKFYNGKQSEDVRKKKYGVPIGVIAKKYTRGKQMLFNFVNIHYRN